MSTVVPGDIDPLSVLQAIESNLLEWYRLVARVMPGAELYEEPDMVRTLLPVRHPSLNAILRVRFAHGTTRRRIQDALQALEERGVPGMWWIGPGTHPVDLASRLPAYGCVPTETLIGMAVDLKSGTWRDRSGCREERLVIREAVETPELEAWALPFSEGFGMRPEVLRALSPVASLVQSVRADGASGSPSRGPCMRFFLASLAGAPVASAMLFLAAGVAGLYGVATVSAQRNRGYGTAVVRFALDAASAEGCRVCILHATPMAVSVYRRLGFVEYCRLRTLVYYPPSASPT